MFLLFSEGFLLFSMLAFLPARGAHSLQGPMIGLGFEPLGIVENT